MGIATASFPTGFAMTRKKQKWRKREACAITIDTFTRYRVCSKGAKLPPIETMIYSMKFTPFHKIFQYYTAGQLRCQQRNIIFIHNRRLPQPVCELASQ